MVAGGPLPMAWIFRIDRSWRQQDKNDMISGCSELFGKFPGNDCGNIRKVCVFTEKVIFGNDIFGMVTVW